MKKCEICGNDHKRRYTTCSKRCTEILKENRDKEHQATIKEQGGYKCEICGRYTHGMYKHLKAHNISIDEYNKKYNQSVNAFSDWWREKNKEHEYKCGKDNPAYNHGGKYSPLSEKFIHYDESKKEDVINKIKNTKRLHPENSSTNIEYWVKKSNGNYDEAKKLLSKRQTTFSLDKCKEKYGEIEGTIIWKERQLKWQNTMNSKSQKEIGEINLRKMGKFISSYKKTLKNIFIKEFNPENVTSQFTLYNNKTKWIFDFKIFDNILVEFNGDYWHMNPIMHKGDDFNKSLQMTSKEIWEKDLNKKIDAENNGFKVITIWESDYISDGASKIIEEIKKYAIK